jgi:predicted  nucleic acid-binding Zn-ribbon protein
LICREKEFVRQEEQETSLRLMQMETEAADVSARVDSEVLTLYRRVQAKKSDHIGIASVCNAVCRGCNVNIPPQMYNELQRFDRLKNCPNCERLIYWDKEEGRSE